MANYSARELANAFRTVRRNTIQAAEDIPEAQYDFVPAPGTKSVSELLRHIAFGPMVQLDMHREERVSTLKGFDFQALIGRVNAAEREPRNKAEIVELLRDEGERFASWLESLNDDFLNETFTDPAGQNPKTRLEALMGAKEHEMHHRGQLMLIERMVGVVPHLTRQRQERALARERAASVVS